MAKNFYNIQINECRQRSTSERRPLRGEVDRPAREGGRLQHAQRVQLELVPTLVNA